ncbi:exported protein of unknown function (plasmid) [Clostridium beijerinckii]|nr:exported protein of unknown function [Clostridium beijerinckii]
MQTISDRGTRFRKSKVVISLLLDFIILLSSSKGITASNFAPSVPVQYTYVVLKSSS